MKSLTKLIMLVGFVFTMNSCSDELPLQELHYEAVTAEVNEETAFANCMSPDHISCFLDDGFNRWGWVNGPVTNGLTSPLIAGAGQCDLDKGTVVGSVDVSYNHATGMVSIIFSAEEGWEITETHLYVGGEPYPVGKNGKPTVAPGKFPHKGQMEYLVPAPNPFYYIAHAVVVESTE
ncbi:hypothetical protein OOZ15_00020 [Galbibacter sp. EGI 63066]|uniref:hypothetical protein n=1 Tax=Galbibacter sp. EGI 63066 TaxID=2993559 RepID=UPI00224908C7|nr:hypothetical protein [Galbibacter sp. EGI 63066]MCX2678314.1 hypothetical protein [Galbibacter sp. EGI 63066]